MDIHAVLSVLVWLVVIQLVVVVAFMLQQRKDNAEIRELLRGLLSESQLASVEREKENAALYEQFLKEDFTRSELSGEEWWKEFRAWRAKREGGGR